MSSLLLYTLGYFKGIHDAKIAVETLRAEWNTFAHSADLLAKQSLTATEFGERWEVVLGALYTIIEKLSPAERGVCKSKIDKITTEKFGQSCIQDLARDANEKADMALKFFQKAATM